MSISAQQSVVAGTMPLAVSQKKRKARRRHNNLAGYVFLSPWLIGFFAFTLFPMAASLLLAFTNYNLLTPIIGYGLTERSLQQIRNLGVPDPITTQLQPLVGRDFANKTELWKTIDAQVDVDGLRAYKSQILKYGSSFQVKWIGMENLKRMFWGVWGGIRGESQWAISSAGGDWRYWNSVKATFFYVFTAIPLRLFFALLVAILLNTSRRMIPTYRALFYSPSIVGSSVAVAVMWRQIFGQDGLINFLLGGFGIAPIYWLGNPSTAIWTVILLAAWQFGSPMLIFLAGLKQIPASLYESASIDGAGKVSQFLHISLPMLTPVILFNMVMQMISGFMIFAQVFIISGGTGAPRDTLLMYALYLYQRAFNSLEMGYSAAMAWVLLVTIALVTALVFKSSKYWVFYESEGGEA